MAKKLKYSLNKAHAEQLMANADRLKMKAPSIVIVQYQSGMDGVKDNYGMLYNTASRTFVERVEFVFVGSYGSRGMYPNKYSAGAGHICISRDGIAPLERYVGTPHTRLPKTETQEKIEGVIPQFCEECPFAFRGCNERLTLQLFDIHRKRPFTFLIERTKWKAAGHMNTEIAMQDLFGEESKTWIMETSEIDDASGNYFLPVFLEGRPVSQAAPKVMQVVELMRQSVFAPRLAVDYGVAEDEDVLEYEEIPEFVPSEYEEENPIEKFKRENQRQN